MAAAALTTDHRARRPRGSRSAQTQSPLNLLIADAYSAIEDLRDEMSEWQESLECNEMEHLDKYSEVEEAASALECALDELDPLKDLVDQLPDSIRDQVVEFTQDTRRKAWARWGRLANAQAMAEAAHMTLEIDLELDAAAEADADEEPTMPEGQRDELEDALQSWESATRQTEDVCFPGMY